MTTFLHVVIQNFHYVNPFSKIWILKKLFLSQSNKKGNCEVKFKTRNKVKSKSSQNAKYSAI